MADNEDGLLLDQQLCFALYAASRTMTQAYQPHLATLKLTYPQYLVMLVLWEEDGLNVKTISARLYLDSGTLTPLLKRLEGLGLIARRRSESDERQLIVALTVSGRKLRRRAVSMRQKMMCRFPGKESQTTKLRDSLHRFTQSLRQ